LALCSLFLLTARPLPPPPPPSPNNNNNNNQPIYDATTRLLIKGQAAAAAAEEAEGRGREAALVQASADSLPLDQKLKLHSHI
jgi:hypothetical protein